MYMARKKFPPSCNNATSVTSASTPPKNHTLQKEMMNFKSYWKLWPELLTNRKDGDGEVVAGFHEAMEAIYRNQHPADCSKAKFLIAKGWDQGFGSEIHVIGLGLAVAMEMNRVYVINPEGPTASSLNDNRWQVNNDYCKGLGKDTLECYYEPWTNCSFEDALAGKSIEQLEVHGKTYWSDTKIIREKLWNLEPKTILYESRGDTAKFVPHMFKRLISCSPIYNTYDFYWWRIVSAAYLLRPNTQTLQYFQKHRMDKTLDFHPKREQCVSVYVRRGDKHVEMPLVPFKRYADAATYMWEKGYVTGRQEGNRSSTNLPTSASDYASGADVQEGGSSQTMPVMFIGSEDQNVIDEAIQWGQEHGWKIVYTNLFNRQSVSAHLNHTEQAALRKSKSSQHHQFEYLSMLLNLDYHLQCDAWVCTMRSNFCRIIEELRASVAGKLHKHYMDVGQHCPGNSCFDRGFYLGW
jgi:hypothetical protein